MFLQATSLHLFIGSPFTVQVLSFYTTIILLIRYLLDHNDESMRQPKRVYDV